MVVVEYQDRLARVGFAHMEQAVAAYGVRGEVLEGPVTPDVAQELVQDMLAIVAVFAARLYGARSRKFRQKVQAAMQEVEALTTVKSSRTIRLKVRPDANPGKLAAPETTAAMWDRAVAFYIEFFLAHLGILAEIPQNKKLLTWAETHTVPTRAHPTPLPGWNIEESVSGLPVAFRRTVINAAIGAVRSYASNRKRWKTADPQKRGKEPKPPHQRPNPTFYSDLYQVETADF